MHELDICMNWVLNQASNNASLHQPTILRRYVDDLFCIFNNEAQLDDFFIVIVIVIVITFYSPSCLGQETAKGPFGLRVKLPPAHLSTTHDGGFTLSL